MRLTTRLFAAAFLILASCAPPAFAAEATPAQPNATAEVINHAIDKASAGLAQVTAMLSHAAPQAWAMAVAGVYAEGMAALIIGLICAVICIIFGLIAAWGLTKCIVAFDKNGEEGAFWLFLVIPCILISLIFLIVASANGLDSDAWARVISPQGYLALQILSKAL